MVVFVALFAGLLAAGMPIFLVLGLCASAMFFMSGQPPVGLAQLVVNELSCRCSSWRRPSCDLVASPRRWSSWPPPGLAAFRVPWLLLPSLPARYLQRFAVPALRPRLRWERF
jgi:hypothetical protein